MKTHTVGRKQTMSLLAVLLTAALLISACAPQVFAQDLTATPDTQSTITPPTPDGSPTGLSTPSGTLTPPVEGTLPPPGETQTPPAGGTQTPTVVGTTTPETPAPITAEESVQALQDTFQEIYATVNPSVVNISSATLITGPVQLPPGHPQIPAIPGQPGLMQGLGSGFVWDDEGHIVTNSHVVAGADTLTISFADGVSLQAEVVGAAPDADLAVIRVDPDEMPDGQLQPVTLGDSDDLAVGQFVVAIGNPFGLEGSMTTGIVSALGRNLPVGTTERGTRFTIPNVIQTDASINPGNSGGVLVDIEGQVIGVNTAIESPVEGSVGIGFAIPANIVNLVVPALIEDGEFSFAYLGVEGTSINTRIAQQLGLDAAQRGFLITGVAEDSPAEEAGLLPAEVSEGPGGGPQISGGDIIIAIDGQTVDAFEDLNAFLVEEAEVGQEVVLTVLRDGEEVDVPVTLAARPQAETVPETGQTPTQRPGGVFLGITGADLTRQIAQEMDLQANQRGVLVIEVVAGSPADEAGLQGSDEQADILGQTVPIGGDVIVALDGTPINNVSQLRALLNSGRVGDEVELTVLRDGDEQTLTVTLGEPSAGQPTGTPRAGTGTPRAGTGTPGPDAGTPSPGGQTVSPRNQTPSPGGQTPSPGQNGSPTAEGTSPATTAPGGYLGILGMSMTPDLAEAMNLDSGQQGVLVAVAEPGGPADQAGLQAGAESATIEGADVPIGGDIIVAVDGEPVETLADLTAYLRAETAPGDSLTLTVLRNGQEQEVEITLGERP